MMGRFLFFLKGEFNLILIKLKSVLKKHSSVSLASTVHEKGVRIDLLIFYNERKAQKGTSVLEGKPSLFAAITIDLVWGFLWSRYPF